MSLSMSVMDSMKDKAARLIPTPYTDLVEESTSELLLVPDYEKIMYLCDSANSKDDHAVDLVRAVRRRLDNKSAKIRYFTIVLLEAMVKNCGLPVHVEIAETKGLLVDLVKAAAKKPSADGEADAKKAALQLIMNMSIWFGEHQSPKVKPLPKLVDAVRAEGATFDGLEPDLSVSLKVDASPPAPGGGGGGNQQRGASRARRQNRAQRHAQFAGHSQDTGGDPNQPRVVTAIPLIIPTDDELSGMLDAAMLLVECLNTAEVNNNPIHGDEIISNIGVQIRRDHRKLSQMIASGAEIDNMEMMLTVCDSQVAVIQRVADAIRAQGAEQHMPAELHQVPQDVMQQQAQHQSPTHPNSQSGGESARVRLVRYFQWYNPDKLDDVDTILLKYQGNEEQLFQALNQKYGPEPSASAFAPDQNFMASSAPAPPPQGYPAPPGYGDQAPAPQQQQQQVVAAPVVPQQQQPVVATQPTPQPVQQQNLYQQQAQPPQQQPAPVVAEQPASPAPPRQEVGRSAMDIDDVPAAPQQQQQQPAPAPAPVAQAPAPAKQEVPTIDELFMGLSSDPAPQAAPQQQEAPAPAAAAPEQAPVVPAQQQASPARAFPAPSQSMNPTTAASSDMTKTDGPEPEQHDEQPPVADTTGSLNDDFDAFLNNRLQN